MWLKVTALRQAQGPFIRGAAAGIGRRGTVAAVALPDTRQRLRQGAELLGGVRDGDANRSMRQKKFFKPVTI